MKAFVFLIEHRNESAIPIDKILNIIEPKDAYLQRVEDVFNNSTNPEQTERCVRGSDLGCCGNYSGCCWFSSWECFTHDLLCLKCEPDWFCLSGCVPEK